MDFDIKENKENRRYEAKIKDVIAFVEYEKEDGITFLLHTEVPETLGGQGVGSKMIRQVLLKIKAENSKVKIQCPFIQEYVDKHPEWRGIVIS